MSFDINDPDFLYLAIDRKKMIKEAAPFDGKKNCWVPDEKEGFAPAEIQSTKGEEITVKILTDQSVSKIYFSMRGDILGINIVKADRPDSVQIRI